MSHELIQDKTNIFSQSQLEIYIYKNFDKLGWSAIAFIVLFVTIRKELSLNLYGIIFIILLCSIIILYKRFIRKVANKIIIDFKNQSINFYLYHTEESLNIDFNDIKKIRINGYIIFVLGDKKIFYKDIENNKLIDCIKKIKQIEWGPLCLIWGPSKSVRETN